MQLQLASFSEYLRMRDDSKHKSVRTLEDITGLTGSRYHIYSIRLKLRTLFISIDFKQNQNWDVSETHTLSRPISMSRNMKNSAVLSVVLSNFSDFRYLSAFISLDMNSAIRIHLT